jgi:transcriptional regulator with XRE-family HTH domain
MGAIHNKVKKLRIQSGLTQQEMADKLNMHLKTWQKVENGFTKLDIDRLKEIAEIFEVSIDELINTDEGVFINEVSGSGIGYSNEEVQITHNYCSENEKALYERMIADKDKQIADKDRQIALLQNLLEKGKNE